MCTRTQVIGSRYEGQNDIYGGIGHATDRSICRRDAADCSEGKKTRGFEKLSAALTNDLTVVPKHIRLSTSTFLFRNWRSAQIQIKHGGEEARGGKSCVTVINWLRLTVCMKRDNATCIDWYTKLIVDKGLGKKKKKIRTRY